MIFATEYRSKLKVMPPTEGALPMVAQQVE